MLPADLSVSVPAHHSLVLLFGFGRGDLVEKICALDHVKCLLVHEPDPEIFSAALSGHDFSAAFESGKLKLVLGDLDPLSYYTAFKRCFDADMSVAVELFNRFEIMSPSFEPRAKDNFLSSLDTYISSIKDLPDAGMNDPYYGFLNTAKNFPEIFLAPHLEQLKGIYRDVPGILVGFGPSLKNGLDYLKQAQKHAIVCAVDVAVKSLLQEGITPDYVVSLERIGGEFCFTPDMPLQDSYLVAPSLVQPEALRAYPGPKLRITTSHSFDHWFSDGHPPDPVGTLSGHMGYTVLAKLGCSPIHLLGNDLSYDPFSGKSYTTLASSDLEGSGAWLKKELYANDVSQLEGFDGKRQATCPLWLDGRRIFAEFLAASESRAFQVFPDGYGIPIPGAAGRLLPEEALGELKKYPLKTRRESDFLRSVPAEELLRLAAGKMAEIRRVLLAYRDNALKILQAISEFHVGHDPSYLAHQKSYDQFFNNVLSAQQELFALGHGFYDSHFSRIFGLFHAKVGLNLGEIYYLEKDFTRSVNARLHWLNRWFTEFHHWSCRLLAVMESHTNKWHD